MRRLLHRVVTSVAWALAGLAALAPVACRDGTAGHAAPSASSSSTAVPVASAAPDDPESPLSIVVEAQHPLVFANLEGGIVVTDAAHTHWAHAAAGGELVAGPMPEGLPEGLVLGAAGRLPGPVWLLYEKEGDGGRKANPLFRLGKEGFKQFADDWKPLLVPWTKRRVLAASTSSGRLKIKVIEPSLPEPPADLPSAHLDDPSCEKTLHLQGLAALPTGEVFAGGYCKPDKAAGAGASAIRYVVIRWASPSRDGSDAGAGDAGHDGGDPHTPGPAGTDERPGTVDVLPGYSQHLSQHVAFFGRAADDVWAVGHDASRKTPQSELFHFDGATWSAVALPESPWLKRGMTGTADGALWMAGAYRLLRRTPSGAWEVVPLPRRASAEEHWEALDIASPDGRDVWISAQRQGPGGVRHFILRSRPAAEPLRWQ